MFKVNSKHKQNMKTRIIHTRIWQDGWFTSISRSSRILFMYLLTCESNNICGIFEIPDRNIMFDTGLSQTELDQAKKDLKEKVIFHNGWIKLLNTEKYNNYVTNPKLEKAFNRELSVVPSKIIEYMNKYDTSIDTSIHTTNNHKSKTINHKSKTKETKNNKDINSLNDEFCARVARNYDVSLPAVLKKKNDLILYCRSTGKRYKDCKATLQAWIRKDLHGK